MPLIEDIATPEGMLTDDDVDQIEAAGGPLAAPTPELRDFYTAHVNQYHAFRQVAPRRVDIQRRAANERKLEDLTLDFDGATKGQELQSLKFAPDEATRAEAKLSLTVDAFMQHHAGQTYSGVTRSMMRDRLATGLFEGKGIGSDGAFLEHARTWATKQKDFRTLTFGPDGGTPEADVERKSSLANLVADAALQGKPYSGAYAAWQNASKGKPGYDASKMERYELIARTTHEALSEKVSALAPVVDDVLHDLRMDLKGSNGDTITDKLLAIPKEDRGLALMLLSKKAEKIGDKNEAGSHILQSAVRGMGEMFMGNFRSRELSTLQDAEDKLSTVKVGDSYGGRYGDFMDFLRGQSSPSMEGRAALFVLEPLIDNKTITQEDLDAAKATIAKDRDKMELAMMVDQVAKGQLDPIKSSGWVTQMGNGFSQSVLPQMAMFALTRNMSGGAVAGGGFVAGALNLSRGAGGVPLLYGMMADQNTQQLLGQNPGMSIAEASSLGRKASYMQTGIEYAQNLLSFGALPMLSKTLMAAQRSPLAVLGKAALIHTATQNATEAAQDILPQVVQALSDDAPKVDWTKVFSGDVPAITTETVGEGENARSVYVVAGQKFDTPRLAQEYAQEHRVGGYWSDRADTALTLLPLIVFGAGGDVVRSRASKAQLESAAAGLLDEAILRAAGIVEADRVIIMAEPDAGKRLDAFNAALPKADAATAEQGAKDLQRRALVQSGAFERAMQQNGIAMERRGETIAVTGPDGVRSEHVNFADASAAVRAHLRESDIVISQPVFDMLDALESRPENPTAESLTTFTSSQESVADALIKAADEGNTALVKSMRDRMAIEQATQPETQIDWSKMRFEGQSQLEVQESVHRAVIKIEAGGSALVPLEERAETDVESWLTSGKLTVGGLAEMVKQVESVTGDTYLYNYNGADADADRLAVKEAFSRLTTIYATGRGKTGDKVGKAARAERAGARARLKETETTGVAQALFERLQASWEFFKQIMVQAARLNKARRDGKLGEIEGWLNKSIGITEETAAARAVSLEAERLYNEGLTPQQESDAILYDGTAEGMARPVRDEVVEGMTFNGDGTVDYDPRVGFSLNSRAAPVDARAERQNYENATVVGPTSFAITAHHGTPHEVDKFSMEKIGTGEGAQAYGWGLYFAASEKVAKSYQENVVDMQAIYKINEQMDEVSRQMDPYRTGMYGKYNDPKGYELEKWYASLMDERDALRTRIGNLYTVELGVNEEDLLDWDKPLSEQSERVQKIVRDELRRIGGGASTGEKFYKELIFQARTEGRGGDASAVMRLNDGAKLASDRLLELGIPGIRFLDGNSRADGSGSYNYVMFSDEPIKITARNGQVSSPLTPINPDFQVAFRLTPINTLDALNTTLTNRMRTNPQARRDMIQRAQFALDQLRDRWTTTTYTAQGDAIRPLVERRSAYELNRETRMREALAVEELTDRIYQERSGILSMDEDLTKFRYMPIASELMQVGSGPPRGRLLSRSAAARSHFFDQSRHGDYDGAEGIPNWMFQGERSPDQAAQDLYEAGLIRDAHVDTMWDALHAEMKTAAKNKKELARAITAIREAKAKAKDDAKAWRAEEDAKQKQDWDPNQVLIRDMRIFDAVLAAFPPEVRQKVGGWMSLLQLKTPEARVKEMQSRIQTLDHILEKHLQADTLLEIESLIIRSEPKREPGKSPRGHLGAEAHRFFKEVTRIKGLTEMEVAKERAGYEVELADETLSPEAALELFEKQQVLDLYGDLKHKSAAEMQRALDTLNEIYNTGKNRWGMIEGARMTEVKSLVQAVLETLGYASAVDKSKADAAALRSTTQATKNVGKGMLLNISSFDEVLTILLGKDSPLVKRWTKMNRQGFMHRNSEVMSTRARWTRALESATGKRGLKARRQLWEMANDPKITVPVQKLIVETVRVPITAYYKMRDGVSSAADLGYTLEEVAQLADLVNALPAGHHNEIVELKRTKKGPLQQEPLTEASATFMTMLAKQAMYQASMEMQGYDAIALAEIERQLSSAAKSLRRFMAGEYRDGYTPLASQFEQMYGVGLPQIKNYAPGAFYATGAQDTHLDVTGTGVVDGGFRSGMLKDRKQHTATPKRENAFSIFFAHGNQTAHWKAMAPFTRELQGVFGNAKVKEAIAGRHGADMLDEVGKWVKALEGNGLMSNGKSVFIEKLINVQAYGALAWKALTLMKQATAALGAAYKIPPSAYIQGLGRLVMGKCQWWAMWNDPIIQNRLQSGFTPEVRAAMNQVWSSQPTLRSAFLNAGMTLIGGTDAFFTTCSAAIAYDYHLRQGLAAGETPEVAHAEARDYAAEIVWKTAQPADVGSRSMLEVELSAEKFGKLLFLYRSEARQKTSLTLNAWANIFSGKGTADDIRALVLANMVIPTILTFVSSMWLDARDDSDTEWFDLDHWDTKDFLKAAALQWMGGVPLLSDITSGFSAKTGGPLAIYKEAVEAAVDLVIGPPENVKEKEDWYSRRAVEVSRGAGAFPAVVANIADQVKRVADNAVDDEEETARKAKSAAAKAKAQAKKDAKP
jgi:hypothetical protein